MNPNDAPRKWYSAPASRSRGNYFLSAIEVGQHGQIFFATDVEPLQGDPPLLVRHPVGDIKRALRIQEYFEQKGVLPW